MHPAKKPKRVTSWQVIGARLADFRGAARMTLAALAESVSLRAETLHAIEQGRRLLKPQLAERLDELLGTKGALAVAVAEVPAHERLPAFVMDYAEHEERALSLLSYEAQMVPALLQTAAYTRVVLSAVYPPVSDEMAEKWVSARQDRQRILRRTPRPPAANFVIEESTLQRPIGGPEVMREQLRHLRRCAELPSVGLQIMPTDCGIHAGLDGPMMLLETPAHDQLAYIETQITNFLVSDPDAVSVYQQKYGMLRSQALSPAQSTRLLDDLLSDGTGQPLGE
ncbi:helix-turn-helix domain-containing protein [Streptomyces sp. NPDC058280]|uniref:helix-turn-helix domain-containing protein n=1 Tax=Streptomyces sp. NPDC058280 TaxID=3346419 RepID=UPI0036E4570A